MNLMILSLLFMSCQKVVIESKSKPRIAITIDDLPYQTKKGGITVEDDSVEWIKVSEKMLGAFSEENANATIFINCGNLSPEDTLVNIWKEAGHSIGNHTANHRSAAHGELNDWVENVQACDRLWGAEARETKWFRFPYLWRGETLERRDSVLKALEENNYMVVPVTADSHDWLFEQYRRKNGDSGWKQTVSELFIANTIEAVLEAQEVSQQKLGREIPQILLLHFNHVTADNLPQILAELKKKEFEIISVDQAMKDPIYQEPDAWFGRGSRMWLSRTEPTEREDGSRWYSNRGKTLRKQLDAELEKIAPTQ